MSSLRRRRADEDQVSKPRQTVSESQEGHDCGQDQGSEDRRGWTLSLREVTGKLDKGGGSLGSARGWLQRPGHWLSPWTPTQGHLSPWGSQARPGSRWQKLYLGVLFSRLFLHPRPRVCEGPSRGLRDRVVSLYTKMGGLREVVVSRSRVELMPDPRSNQWIGARSEGRPCVHQGQPETRLTHGDHGGGQAR